jgi:hypothetical protein
MGLGVPRSDDAKEEWHVGDVPSRREVIAFLIAFIVISSLVYYVVEDEEYYDGDTCGWRPPVEIHLSSNGTESWRSENMTMWNAWFVCSDISGDISVPWSDVMFSIPWNDDVPMVGHLEPAPAIIPRGAIPVGYFRDVIGDPSSLEVGDHLCLANLNRTHEGTWLEMFDPEWYPRTRHSFPVCDSPYSLELTFLNASIPKKGMNVWDVTYSVRAVSPDWEQLPWSFIRTRTLNPRGGVQDRYEFHPFSPLEALGERRWEQLMGYYNDSGSIDGIVDVGDKIVVSGDWSKYAGTGSAYLYTGNASIAAMDLLDMPDPQVRFEFSKPNLTSRVVSGDGTVWDCEFIIESIQPEQGYLEWGNPWVEVPGNDPDLDIPWWASSDKGTYPDSAQVFFREVEPVDGRVDVGDAIVIKSMTTAFEGRTLVMKGPGTTIRLDMPTHFVDEQD